MTCQTGTRSDWLRVWLELLKAAKEPTPAAIRDKRANASLAGLCRGRSPAFCLRPNMASAGPLRTWPTRM